MRAWKLGPADGQTARRRRLARWFHDLRVRPKLIVLHNLFFLVLTFAVYFTLIPLIEDQVAISRRLDTDLLVAAVAAGRPLPPGLEASLDQDASASALGADAELRRWMDQNPGEPTERPAGSGIFYRKDPTSGHYQRLEASGGPHEQLVNRARIYLFAVLGIVYVLAVLLLELLIIPRYVYRPIQLTLDADQATREGDRKHEIIDASLIPGDEIGDIMRSRNQTVAELREQEASLAQALAVQEDLSRDLQRKNDMLEAAKQSMMIQDRLVSLGLLSASVAHELNTPLAVLHGSIEKLLETVRDPATQGRLERMQRVALRLQRISTGLLDFSRARKHEDLRDSVPLQPLINEAWDLVAIDERAAGVAFSNDVSPGHQVLGDGDRLMQVFVNLLRNALLAVPAEGHVTVHSEQVVLEGREWILASVDDNGIGIPEDVLPNLFEAFVTSRLDSQGTGLGLTVANGIVERHGGAIVASNRLEGGARLQVKLPAAAVAARTAGGLPKKKVISPR